MKSNCNTYMGTVSISDEACLKGNKCKERRENQKKMNTGHWKKQERLEMRRHKSKPAGWAMC